MRIHVVFDIPWQATAIVHIHSETELCMGEEFSAWEKRSILQERRIVHGRYFGKKRFLCTLGAAFGHRLWTELVFREKGPFYEKSHSCPDHQGVSLCLGFPRVRCH